MAEKQQSAVPIIYSCRNDNERNKEDVVIVVKDILDKRLKSVAVDESSIQPSIYKIPKFMKGIDEGKAFEPQLVSLGPYHHGTEHLLPMEQEKLKAYCHFITENQMKFESIAEIVYNNLEYLLGAYDNLDEKWKKDDGAKFIEVMVVDACFMLDFFKKCPSSLTTLELDIKRDMLLLENQLPMKLLQLFYDKISNTNQVQDDQSRQSLKSLICNSVTFIENEKAVTGKELHILDMYRASLLYPLIDRNDYIGKPKEYENESAAESQVIPQATQLREAGIKFKNSPTTSLTDVSFDKKNGVLSIPFFTVDDDSETTLLNVMAFEKLHEKAGSEVTSFIILMNNLIDVDKDVELLEDNKILANLLGNDQDAADLFSLLGKGAALDLDSHGHIIHVHYEVNQHCSKPWNKWCAFFKHNYFQNPWAGISFLAAIFAFAILIVQAVYQVVDFHRGN